MAATTRTVDDGVYPADPRLRPAGRCISWGAVVAGVEVALVVPMLLMLLGMAIRAATIDPVTADTPQASTPGTGGAAWWRNSTAITVFTGARVAARLAAMPSRLDGGLRGIVTSAAATLIASISRRPLSAARLGVPSGRSARLRSRSARAPSRSPRLRCRSCPMGPGKRPRIHSDTSSRR